MHAHCRANDDHLADGFCEHDDGSRMVGSTIIIYSTETLMLMMAKLMTRTVVMIALSIEW